jgi:predicted nucleotidyltransferase
MVTDERRQEVNDLVDRAVAWARARSDVRALGMVGSWARAAERMDSDVDLVVVTDDVQPYVRGEEWIKALEGRSVIRTQQWGPLMTERRLLRESGLEVEVGLVTKSWASTDPVDEGTRAVVLDGMRVLYDPERILTNFQQACLSSLPAGG